MDTRIVYATSHDGVRIACSVRGSGLPLISIAQPIFSHCGMPAMGAAAFGDRIAAQRRLIRVDLRGCGMADWNPPTHTVDDYLHDLLAILETLKLEQADILAFGVRTAVAIRMAAVYPEKVRRLYLDSATVGLSGLSGRKLVNDTMQRLAMDDWPLYVETIASRILGSEEDVAENARRMLKCTDADNLSAALAAVGATDVTEDLPMLRCPTLVTQLEDNTTIEPGHGERFVSLVPHAQLRYLPYKPRTEWLEDFAAAIEGFDAELDGPSARPRAAEVLSEREIEVLRLLAEGRRNSEVAAALVVSEATVRTHIAHIYAKLNVRNRAEATRWALTHGNDPTR